MFSWEESLFKIRPNWRKGCQLHLTENLLQGIPLKINIFSAFNKSIRYRSHFHKNLQELMQVKLVLKFVQKTSSIYWTHFSKWLLRIKGVVLLHFSAVFYIETVIWFALKIMPGFYAECYTGLKWVERE